MTPTTTTRSFSRLAGTARGFTLVALAVPLLWEQDAAALPYLVSLASLWAVASWLQDQPLPTWCARVDLLEAALVGLVCALALPSTVGLLAALALPPFLSGLRFGFRGAAGALAAELILVVGVTAIGSSGMDSQQWGAVFAWAVTGLGLGLVAGFFSSTQGAQPDALAPYRDARQLILELLDLSGGLSSGLDPVALGQGILDTVLDGVPAAALAVHVPRGADLTPLTRRVVDPAADPGAGEGLAPAAFAESRVLVSGRAFAFPLRTDAGAVAVVTGVLSGDQVLEQIDVSGLVQGITDQLGPRTIRLDTALLFAAFRDAATADERRRLAREMHDGMAQDIASMGYLVDALAAAPASPQQAEQLRLLRDAITSVVAEVRRSVLTLRSSAEGADSLGAAVSGLARHLSALSGVPITVTVDEQTTRLRPEVEAELLRIAQEAMNNAVRHAQASQIEVECRVDPPAVTLLVADNGRGLQGRRADSHGLEIMNERARLIGADLRVGNRPEGGTQVSVRISSGKRSDSPTVVREKEAVPS